MHIVEKVPSVDEATAVTGRGFVRPVTAELWQDVSNHLEGDVVLSLTSERGLLGFATFCVHRDLLFLAGVQIDPRYQGKAVVRKMITHARLRTGAAFFGLRTQSSVMWAAGRAVCSEWWPGLGHSLDGMSPELHNQMEHSLQLARSPTALHKGCYGSPLYGEKPVHRDDPVQDWWDSICDFSRGDAVVCVGVF